MLLQNNCHHISAFKYSKKKISHLHCKRLTVMSVVIKMMPFVLKLYWTRNIPLTTHCLDKASHRPMDFMLSFHVPESCNARKDAMGTCISSKPFDSKLKLWLSLPSANGFKRVARIKKWADTMQPSIPPLKHIKEII